MHGLNRPVTRQLPPVAQRRPKFSVHHGVELVDEYAWLRADNWQEVMRDPSVLDPQIRAYLEAENAYTEAALADTAALQATLYAEMKARIKEDDSSVPAPDGAYEYYMQLRHRRPVSAPVPAAARRRAREHPARRQQGGRGTALLAARVPPRTAPTTAISPMPSTRRARSSSPSRSATSPPARTCARRMPDTRSAIVWGGDSKTLFYVRLDANQRPLYVYRHRVGTPGKSDVLDLRGEGQRLLRRRRPDPVRRASSPSRRTITRPPRST